MRPIYLGFALAASAILACSGDPAGTIDGDWYADPPDAGSGVTPDGAAVAKADGGAPAGDASIALPDAAAPKDAAAVVPDASNCLNGVAPPSSGKHHPGDDCMSCHDGLSASIRWTVAGTLYTTVNGTTAISGANIEIIDAANKKVVLATSTNGNFYTTQTFTFPVKVRASKCPNDAKMVAGATGSCNANSCHNSTMRIHLP